MEHVVADSQVVLQAERLQHHSVPDRERQPQLLVGVSWEGRGETRGVMFIRAGSATHQIKLRRRSSDTIWLTWGRRQRCHIWFHVRRKRGLHVRIRRQVWRNTTSWGHRGCRVSRNRGVGVVSRPRGLLQDSQQINKSVPLVSLWVKFNATGSVELTPLPWL